MFSNKQQMAAADLFSIQGSECFVEFNGINGQNQKGEFVILNKPPGIDLEEIDVEVGKIASDLYLTTEII